MSNLEQYTLTYIREMWQVYEKYLKDNKYKDIDYPGVKFSNKDL